MKISGKKFRNISPPLGTAPPPFSKTRSISANYEPLSTKFSGISAPTRWQRIGKKMLKNTTPSWGCPTLHILKYCQLLHISENYEPISMKSSGISLLARRREMGKKNTKISHPLLGLPRQPQPPNSKTRAISANYKPISTQFSGFSVQLGGQEKEKKC